LEIEATLGEKEGADVRPGQNVTFNVDSLAGRTFLGIVTSAVPAASSPGHIATYKVLMHTDNPDLILKPGMTVRLNIILAGRRRVLTVPNTALTFQPGKASRDNQEQVYILGPNRQPRPVAVKTGITNGRRTEILQGNLPEGSRVIVEQLQ